MGLIRSRHLTACARTGRELVADVAMGETPTHGKIKVSLSPSVSLDGADRDAGAGPLDDSADCAESFKTVEWYGTIRLLVFVRKGQWCRGIRKSSVYW